MTRSACLLVLLIGCGVVDQVPELSPAAIVAPTGDMTVDELSRVDVRGTVTSIERLSDQIHDLSPEQQVAAAESLQILSVNCPYTRAALQLPFALQFAVANIDAERIDPFVRGDWLSLQAGLATHVALLDTLEVDLPMPGPKDALHGHPALLDRHGLLASEDPIAKMLAWVPDLSELAASIDPSTSDLIEHHSERVEAVTGIGRPCPRGPGSILPGQPWTLGMQLGGWHDALRRIRPFVTDLEVQAQIDEMVEVLDLYERAPFEAPARR